MKEINLTNSNLVILIDDEDYEKLSKYGWYKNVHGYAVRRDNSRKLKCVFMHREIMNISESEFITDHINHNKLDNRKENLRVCTKLENNKNIKKYTDREYTSKYKGVHWQKNTSRWRVNVVVDKKRIFVGYYNIEVHAAIAYNRAAIKHHGEFACLNDIPEEFKNIEPVETYVSNNHKNKKSSKYIGVTLCKKTNKWIVTFTFNKKRIYIGIFEKDKDAAKARDQVARYFGITKLNFPNEVFDIIDISEIIKKYE